MADDTNPGVASEAVYHREATKLLTRMKTLRDMQDANPGEPPLGLSDDDLARRLSWDMVSTLTRGTVVLDVVTPAILAYTEALLEQNALKRQELGVRERELAREETAAAAAKERDDRVWGMVSRCFTGAYGWVSSILGARELKLAIITAIVSSIGTIGTIVVGYLVASGWLPSTP